MIQTLRDKQHKQKLDGKVRKLKSKFSVSHPELAESGFEQPSSGYLRLVTELCITTGTDIIGLFQGISGDCC